MSLLDELKTLVNRGPAAVVPEPEPVAAPAVAPVAEQKQATSEPVILSEDKMAEIRVQESKVVPIVEEPEVVVQVAAIPVVPAESLDESLDEFGENPEADVDPVQEVRTDIHPRSRKRIAFLLKTYELGNMERTLARIASDKERHAHFHPQDFSQKPRPAIVPGNPQLYLSGE
jgi:hypothetical protein